MNPRNHQELVVIEDAIQEIDRLYGPETAGHLAHNLRGLGRKMRVTVGDVERYLPRQAYLKWMGFE